MQDSLKEKSKTIVGLIIILALLLFFVMLGIRKRMLPVITIKVDSIEIRQGETFPEPEVHIAFNGKDQDIILDEETKYTIKHLIDELNQGKGYSLKYNVDNTKEGEYSLEVVVEEELKDKFIIYWKNKVKLKIESGSVKVLEVNTVDPNRPLIALTFDDGPSKFTMQLLEILEKNNVKATFFMVGSNVERYPDVLQKMQELGCELGNHTMNHVRLTELDDAGIVNEIEGTNVAVSNILGKGTNLLRPPYGAVDDRVKALANVPVVLWSVDTRDWEVKDASKVSAFVLETVKDGDIVLMHDIYDTTVQAVEEMIPQLIERGYQFVTVSEMAKARGITLEKGKIYSKFYK